MSRKASKLDPKTGSVAVKCSSRRLAKPQARNPQRWKSQSPREAGERQNCVTGSCWRFSWSCAMSSARACRQKCCETFTHKPSVFEKIRCLPSHCPTGSRCFPPCCQGRMSHQCPSAASRTIAGLFATALGRKMLSHVLAVESRHSHQCLGCTST